MRILSGIQPTGEIHIGNYLGAVKQWIELQKNNECMFPIVDLHALTAKRDPKTFKVKITEKAAELLALGINPKKCILFVQSHVKEHTELAWILNTITPVSELERMTQFKDKSNKVPENINMGLMSYPILMAADILLYKIDGVPVGKDQLQHLELTRTIAKKFNKKYTKTFKEPKAILKESGEKIMSLTDPKRKMSKSDESNSYISMFDNAKDIERKILKATTDTGKEIKFDIKKKPGISNLLTIYSLFSEKSIPSIEKEFKGKGYAEFKKALAILLIKKLTPFSKKKKQLLSNNSLIQRVLSDGAKKAHKIASNTMKEVRKNIGIA